MMDSNVRCLAVRTSREADDLVRVTIEDTGSGINEVVAPNSSNRSSHRRKTAWASAYPSAEQL